MGNVEMGFILDTYATWDDAFEFFNNSLFGGELPPVAFGIAKQKGSRGHYAPNRYITSEGEPLSEIQMDAGSLARGDLDSMGTLVHEMTHHWQEKDPDAKPGRGKYHNMEWAAKMREIGLAPQSATTGDKGTGDRVTHDIMDEGPFAEAYERWAERGYRIMWHGATKPATASALAVEKAKRKSKTKYTCPVCGNNAWGKPDMYLFDEHAEQFVEEV